jgi:DNA-binding NarL/FixJ family response regulator
MRKVLSGGRYVSTILAEKFARDLLGDGSGPSTKRCPSEFEIRVMIGAGKAVGQIAEELHLNGTTRPTRC